MGFMTPKAPLPPPPPPNPPTVANAQVQEAGAAQRAAAAAAAGGMGYDGTVQTSPLGASTPATAGGKSTLGDK